MKQSSEQAAPWLDGEQVQAAWALMMNAERIALLAHEHPDGE